MKILILTDRYPPYYEGGYELMCYQITEGLRLRNHELVVLTTTYGVKTKSLDGHVHRKLSYKNIRPLEKWQRRAQDIKQSLVLKHDYEVARRLVMEFKPDLVFIWHMSGTSLSSILAVQDLGVQTVFCVGSQWLVSQRGDYTLDADFLMRFYRLALLGFRRFEEINFRLAIMVSNSLKQKYCLSGFTVDATVVIPNGIPIDLILKNDRQRINLDGTVRLLFAGRLEYEKGAGVAAQALEYLVGQLGCYSVSLDFIGEGKHPFVDVLKNNIVKNGLQKYTRFLGFLPHEELIHRYKEYDIVLFPSVIREGFGMIIIEAMSQGAIVIASNVGGPGDIIEDGRDGLLVSPNDPVALASAIYSLIQSPDMRSQMSKEAIHTVISKFTFERMLDQYEIFLESCLSAWKSYQ